MSETTSSLSSATSGHSTTEQVVHEAVIDWLRTEAGMKIDHVDLDASLYELGVDSLGAATICCEMEQTTRKKIDPEVIYELETIKELASYLDSIEPQQVVSDVEEKPELPPTDTLVKSGSQQKADPVQHYARLNRRVQSLKEQGLYFFEPEISEHDGTWVVVNDQRMLMLSSYEYLGLLGHPHLQETAIKAIDQFGTGHHGARLLVGTTTVHKRLEAKLADFMGAEDAIVFSSGYVANLATISALVGPGDYIIGDQWNHASIMDGCRMSGADFVEFKHNDPGALAECLEQANGRKTLVIVDAVFSMDGDIVDLPEVVYLCKKHNALLMVDEAHSLGVLGNFGRGIQEHFDLEPDDIDIKMGTLSKTLSSSGGFVAGCDHLITYLRHHARGYIFSGALPACQASVSIAALEVIEQNPDLVAKLWENTDQYLTGLRKIGFNTAGCETPIVPVMTNNDQTTLQMTQICRSRGLLVVPVCYPAVPMDAPRLRTCVSAAHTSEDIDFALEVLQYAGRQTNLIA